MPSPSEAPSGGAKPFASFLAFEKGSRCKSETISGRYRSNGYVLRSNGYVLRQQSPTGFDAARINEQHPKRGGLPVGLFSGGRERGASDGQMHAKGIHAMVAAHEHIAAMHQGNRLDDGQAQPVVVATVAA